MVSTAILLMASTLAVLLWSVQCNDSGGLRSTKQDRQLVGSSGEPSVVFTHNAFEKVDFVFGTTWGGWKRHVNVIGDLVGFPQEYFQSARSGRSFHYKIDEPALEKGQTYAIRLGFAETTNKHCSVGSRLIDITVNGETFVSKLDVFMAVGCRNALVVEKQFVLQDSGFDILFESSLFSWRSPAMISVIEIARVVTESPTDSPTEAPSSSPTVVPSVSPSEAPKGTCYWQGVHRCNYGLTGQNSIFTTNSLEECAEVAKATNFRSWVGVVNGERSCCEVFTNGDEPQCSVFDQVYGRCYNDAVQCDSSSALALPTTIEDCAAESLSNPSVPDWSWRGSVDGVNTCCNFFPDGTPNCPAAILGECSSGGTDCGYGTNPNDRDGMTQLLSSQQCTEVAESDPDKSWSWLGKMGWGTPACCDVPRNACFGTSGWGLCIKHNDVCEENVDNVYTMSRIDCEAASQSDPSFQSWVGPAGSASPDSTTCCKIAEGASSDCFDV